MAHDFGAGGGRVRADHGLAVSAGERRHETAAGEDVCMGLMSDALAKGSIPFVDTDRSKGEVLGLQVHTHTHTCMCAHRQTLPGQTDSPWSRQEPKQRYVGCRHTRAHTSTDRHYLATVMPSGWPSSSLKRNSAVL